MSQWPPTTPEAQRRQVLGALPAQAQKKFKSFAAAVDDLAALVAVAQERAKALEDQYQHAANRLRLADPRAPELIRELRGEMEATQAELAALMQERDGRSAAKGAAEAVLNAAERFLAGGIHFPVRVVEAKAEPQEGESLTDAIARVRSEISNAEGDLHATKGAPPSRDEIKQTLTAEVARLAHQGRPQPVLDGGRIKIEWPDGAKIGGGVTPLAATSLICWLFEGQMLAALTRNLDKLPEGLSARERAKRIAELEETIRRLEHVEESLVLAALAKGLEVRRRSGVSGYALLQIETIPVGERMAAAG